MSNPFPLECSRLRERGNVKRLIGRLGGLNCRKRWNGAERGTVRFKRFAWSHAQLLERDEHPDGGLDRNAHRLQRDFAIWVIIVWGITADHTLRRLRVDALVIDGEKGKVRKRVDTPVFVCGAHNFLMEIVDLFDSVADEWPWAFSIDVALDGLDDAIFARSVGADFDPGDTVGVRYELFPVLEALLSRFQDVGTVAHTSSVGFVKQKTGKCA